tara:strand:+ start:12178 stop:13281 length:1104 start_codon:yes stop_codon:yes gene_type:complete
MKIFILSGEPSGDEYGALLMKNIKERSNNVTFIGIGGNLMSRQGLQSIVPLNQISIMGFFEVIKNIFFFLNLEKKILEIIKKENPDKIILIDYPGLNLRLAPKIKSFSRSKIFYYISPQIWAWKEKRLNKIKKFIDHMIVIFEFEKMWYQKRNYEVHYVGHPFLDIWQKDKLNEFINQYNLDVSNPILTLFPGSRKQEINKHLKLFIDVANELKKSVPKLQILIGLNKNVKINHKINNNIILVRDNPLKALEIANAAIIASGTATLQSAIMRTPAAVVYKMNVLSWWMTKFLVKVKFASMVNIIANKMVFKEFLQEKATINNIKKEIEKILMNEKYKKEIMSDLNLINKKIGLSGATKKAASFIMSN